MTGLCAPTFTPFRMPKDLSTLKTRCLTGILQGPGMSFPAAFHLLAASLFSSLLSDFFLASSSSYSFFPLLGTTENQRLPAPFYRLSFSPRPVLLGLVVRVDEGRV